MHKMMRDDVRRAMMKMEQKRLGSARELFDQVMKAYQAWQDQAYISYRYGVLYWGEIGDGEEARRLFQVTVEMCDQCNSLSDEELNELEANACENLMLLSLSYDEYEAWAHRLEHLQPQNPILSWQRPQILKGRDKGYPWSQVMLEFSTTYWHPTLGSGKLASAACILQLLLKHRNTQRLGRKEWGMAINKYIAVNTLIVKACGMKLDHEVDEFIFIAYDALPLIEEYTRVHPADKEVNELYKELQGMIKLAAHLKASGGSRQLAEQMRSDEQRRPDSRFLGRLAMLLLLSGIAGWLLGMSIGLGVFLILSVLWFLLSLQRVSTRVGMRDAAERLMEMDRLDDE